MNQELLDRLGRVTEEEQRILDGTAGIEKKLYASGEEFTIDYAKLLETGQLITVRTHTRFAHFPMHRHNYVEVMYICQGSVTHIINHKKIRVSRGELLFLNQYTRHEILPAGRNDIAINFVILPEFFDVASEMIGRNNVLADFIVNTLRQDERRGEYLYFKVADVLQIQNLIENMIYYGSMADKYIIMLQILDTRKEQDMDVATRVSVQLQLTDPDLKSRDRVVKKSEKDSLYAAMDVGSIWLERALAGKL